MTTQYADLAEPLAEELLPKFFKALSDPTRIKIIQLLTKKERNVSELIATLGVSQSGVSNHLACLKWCGFVTSRREGRRTYYRVTDERITNVLEFALRMISDNAQSIYACTRI